MIGLEVIQKSFSTRKNTKKMKIRMVLLLWSLIFNGS